MVRYLPILLGTCLAIISGLIAAVGVRALSQYEIVAADPLEMTFDEFYQSRPDDVFRYRLTEIQHGSSVYPQPVREDGDWEDAYICLFPKRMKRLGKSYASIIVKVKGVKSSTELAEKLKDGSLEVFYWPTKQDLPKGVYNRMAQKYRGMQFQKCLHCEAGGPPPSPEFGNSCIYFGIGGVSISVFGVLGFYVLRMLGLFRSKDSWDDDQKQGPAQVNRAGLPDSWAGFRKPQT